MKNLIFLEQNKSKHHGNNESKTHSLSPNMGIKNNYYPEHSFEKQLMSRDPTKVQNSRNINITGDIINNLRASLNDDNSYQLNT